MSRAFPRPVFRPGGVLDEMGGGGDPAEVGNVARDTAAALVRRDEQVVTFVAAHGVDQLAGVWASSPADSLPGALWRFYLVGQLDPAAPDDVLALTREVLGGRYLGDVALALDTVAAFYNARDERYAATAKELASAASRWRAGRLMA